MFHSTSYLPFVIILEIYLQFDIVNGFKVNTKYKILELLKVLL